MENFRQKSNFLKLIDSYQGDKSISVEELYNKFKLDLETKKEAENNHEKEVISEFSGTYLKFFDPNGRFDQKELTVLKIDSLEVETYTDRWDRVYKASGSKVYVGICGVTVTNLDSRSDSHFIESELKKFTKISKKEFDEFFAEGNSINERINQLFLK